MEPQQEQSSDATTSIHRVASAGSELERELHTRAADALTFTADGGSEDGARGEALELHANDWPVYVNTRTEQSTAPVEEREGVRGAAQARPNDDDEPESWCRGCVEAEHSFNAESKQQEEMVTTSGEWEVVETPPTELPSELDASTQTQPSKRTRKRKRKETQLSESQPSESQPSQTQPSQTQPSQTHPRKRKQQKRKKLVTISFHSTVETTPFVVDQCPMEACVKPSGDKLTITVVSQLPCQARSPRLSRQPGHSRLPMRHWPVKSFHVELHHAKHVIWEGTLGDVCSDPEATCCSLDVPKKDIGQCYTKEHTEFRLYK